MASSGSKSGKKGIGRSKRKPASVRYSQSERWKWNKVRSIIKHMIKFPDYKPFNLSLDISDKVRKEYAKIQ